MTTRTRNQMEPLFAGVEGGASTSKLVVVSRSGKVVSRDDFGPATNHWLIGSEECLKRIGEMVRKSSYSSESLECLTLCLSGCEEKTMNSRLENQFKELFPSLSKHVIISSDTSGALNTVSDSEGMVLIAGTGSNCVLFTKDGNQVKCGGWGHVLGDQGSAFQIARAAIKTVIETEERFSNTWSLSDCQRVKHVVFNHFQVNSISGLLDPIYGSFDKSHVAAIAKDVASLAEEGDPVAKELFFRAGKDLGRHVVAVCSSPESQLSWDQLLVIACVGSVFKSWNLLKQGFKEALTERGVASLPQLELRRVTSSAALGAALMGARLLNVEIACEKSFEILNLD